jgi:hypothetical protein
MFKDSAFSVSHMGNVVLETNLAGTNDRELNGGNNTQHEHFYYSVTKFKNRMFGTYGVYRDIAKARNSIRVVIAAHDANKEFT